MRRQSIDDDTGPIPLRQGPGAPTQQAAESIYLKYWHPLQSRFRQLGAKDEECEELTHALLIKVIYTKLHLFTSDEDGSFQAWLNRIAHNDYVNWKTRERRLLSIDDADDESAEILSEENVWKHALSNGDGQFSAQMRSNYTQFDEFEVILDLERLIIEAGLTDLERSVILLKVCWDLRSREIAELLKNQTPAEVSRIYYTARRKLGKYYHT
jgi:RNA polymerase sigma factor (sigma-70 family)